MKKRVFVIAVQVVFVMVMGGCNWKPWSTSGDDTDKARDDAGVSENEKCTLKLSACRNSCYEANSPAGCLPCCKQNADACDRGDDYSFYQCPDKD